MSLEQFERHLAAPAPGFWCYDCVDRGEAPKFLAIVSNVVGRPGGEESLIAADALDPSPKKSLVQFVKLHDGVKLYCDSKSDAAGLEFFRFRDWPMRAEEMRETLRQMGFDESTMPEWFHSGVVIGEIPQSANYFVVGSHGETIGQVFYCDHDDFTSDPIANSFDEFLQLIVRDPPRFMFNRGCYTRYSDGKSKVQWIPKEFVTDTASF